MKSFLRSFLHPEQIIVISLLVGLLLIALLLVQNADGWLLPITPTAIPPGQSGPGLNTKPDAPAPQQATLTPPVPSPVAVPPPTYAVGMYVELVGSPHVFVRQINAAGVLQQNTNTFCSSGQIVQILAVAWFDNLAHYQITCRDPFVLTGWLTDQDIRAP